MLTPGGELERFRTALSPAYLVERELGRGGAATVLLAVDRKHDRRVAVKVLRPELFDAASVARFLREIALTAGLVHPHILPLLDSGEVLGLPYYVMPFVDGESLRERIRRAGRLPVDDALAVARDVADALACAHRRGVLHRDVKPGNVMLLDRHALVADFGIAKAMRAATADDHRTEAGVAIGTPAYMSPEQAAGLSDIDGRSDVYSLGVVLCEMLAGAPLARHLGPSAGHDVFERLVATVPGVRGLPPTAREALRRVVARALAPLPDDRFATADEMLDALRAASGEAAPAPAALGAASDAIPDAGEAVRSLAVLPFANLGVAPETDYLSDGITEEILTRLARLRSVRVCGRASSFAFRGKEGGDDVRAIGERLGVGAVLLGSVRRAGDRLRVTARLVDTRSGFQLWSEGYDRELADVFALQDEIASAIVGALRTTLGDATAAVTRAAGSVEAYEALLQGRYFWNQRTEAGARPALRWFARAIELDPRCAPGYAGLADVWAMRALYGTAPPHEAMRAARAAAQRALALDPGLAEAHTTLGLAHAIHEWDWAAAERSFRAAIAANPGYPTAHQWLAAVALTPHARFDDALASLDRARELDPLASILEATRAGVLLYARRHDDAVAAAGRAIALDERSAIARFFLAQALTQLARHDAAVAQAQRACDLSGESSETLAALGHALGAAGAADRARAVLARLEERAAERYVAPTHLAQLWLALGEPVRALDALDAAVGVRAADLIWVGVRPSYDALRAEPRFVRILHRLGLAGAFQAPQVREA